MAGLAGHMAGHIMANYPTVKNVNRGVPGMERHGFSMEIGPGTVRNGTDFDLERNGTVRNGTNFDPERNGLERIGLRSTTERFGTERIMFWNGME